MTFTRTVRAIQREKFSKSSWMNFFKGVQTLFCCRTNSYDARAFNRDWSSLSTLEKYVTIRYVLHTNSY